ncbi:helix-turn-helix domain-containing protein [Streptomyces sp. NPDC018059]|uniref:helix-turn-helix domain-containing protein n=1 Tax=Streptomyces sp. NPDC018059 TaxID=3365041 RepID=UPI0037B59A67
MTTATAELLTVPEVMARLKLGRTKVYDLIRTKRLVSITEGRARRIPESSLQAYVRTRLEEAAG